MYRRQFLEAQAANAGNDVLLADPVIAEVVNCWSTTWRMVPPRAPETSGTALAFLWFSFVLVAKWTGSQAPATRLNTLHLLFGLMGIAAIQAVLWVFEANLGHRSHPSEIKEFLFSVCFVAFALGAALPVSGKAVAR